MTLQSAKKGLAVPFSTKKVPYDKGGHAYGSSLLLSTLPGDRRGFKVVYKSNFFGRKVCQLYQIKYSPFSQVDKRLAVFRQFVYFKYRPKILNKS